MGVSGPTQGPPSNWPPTRNALRVWAGGSPQHKGEWVILHAATNQAGPP